jgi:hypothetical protein
VLVGKLSDSSHPWPVLKYPTFTSSDSVLKDTSARIELEFREFRSGNNCTETLALVLHPVPRHVRGTSTALA